MVLTAAFLTSATTTLVGGGATAAALPSSPELSNRYLIDTMLRPVSPAAANRDTAVQEREIAPILVTSLTRGSMAPADRAYLVEMVSATAGISAPDAEKRVDEADRDARVAADSARRATAHALYWTFLALLVGAFSASVAATIGGRERDRVREFNS
jgi:hypothetical protein